MKKIFGFIAILLVALTPMVFAHEDGTEHEETDTNAEVSGKLRVNAAMQKDRLLEARKKLQIVKTVRAEVRENMKVRKEKLSSIADELKACKGQDTEECKQKRTEAKVQAKETLQKSAEQALEHLQKLKEHISSSDLENKNEIIAEIDVKIQAVSDIKVKIDALTQESTKDEVRELAKELREELKEVRIAARMGAHRIVAHRLGGVLEKSEHLQERLENMIAKLSEQGVDTSSVDMAGFNAKIELAISLHAEAKALYEQSKTAEGDAKSALMKQATEKLRESHAALKEAHELLREILHQLKELRGELKVSAEAGVEANSDAVEVNAESSTNVEVSV